MVSNPESIFLPNDHEVGKVPVALPPHPNILDQGYLTLAPNTVYIPGEGMVDVPFSSTQHVDLLSQQQEGES